MSKMNTMTNNYSNYSANKSESIENIHLSNVFTYFEGSNEPPSEFFKLHTWILYLHLGVCVHGFFVNTFLVITILLLFHYLISKYMMVRI